MYQNTEPPIVSNIQVLVSRYLQKGKSLLRGKKGETSSKITILEGKV